MKLNQACFIFASVFILSACGGQNKCYQEDNDSFVRIVQTRGRNLSYSPESGLRLLSVDGFAFKDMNRNGELDPYEDWRLPSVERAENLASQLPVESIAGLMLYSTHQRVPTDQWGWWPSTYDGCPTHEDAGLPAYAVSDTMRYLMTEHHMRGFLMAGVESNYVAVQWVNSLQRLAESLPFGIPVNICSDPRHETEARAEYNAGSGGDISLWPPEIGLAATFDPEVAREHGRVLAREFRALGIATALSPQVDLASEPRWNRFYGTFGENPALLADMSRAYIDGCQTSPDSLCYEKGWGSASVNAMAKHWPGGGAEEGGRDAHWSWGKYCVYPGDNLQQSIDGFVKGALKLDGPTRSVSAIMPYYTISYGADPSGDNVGNGFSHYLISDILRGKYKYDGLVCTDWGIILPYEGLGWSNGRPWGLENLSSEELHLRVIEAGVDQFGGANDIRPVMAAYRALCEKYGEQQALERFRVSAVRLLLQMFRTGLFDDPYVDPALTASTVGCSDFVDAGYRAQQKSLIMLKNHGGVLPVRERRTVYLPKLEGEFCTDSSIVAKYYDVRSDPDSADFAIVFIVSPATGDGYSQDDRRKGGNGYLPMTLQYEDYTAVDARETSIAGGDPLESFTNRSFRGKSAVCSNRNHLGMLRSTRELMGDKPVVCCVSFLNPFVPASVDELSDAILLLPWIQHQVALDAVSGAFEPSGLLPMQMPSGMTTVELQYEDVPMDMECYTDADGNTYDFAFGLGWNGVINDKRVKKYKKIQIR